MIVIVEKDFPSGRNHNHRSGRRAFNLHNALHLFFFVLTRKNWEANIEFIQDTAKRPHIDSGSILDAKHDFWGTIEP